MIYFEFVLHPVVCSMSPLLPLLCFRYTVNRVSAFRSTVMFMNKQSIRLYTVVADDEVKYTLRVVVLRRNELIRKESMSSHCL